MNTTTQKLIILFAVICALPLRVFSQSVIVATDPVSPKEGEPVVVSVSSYLFDFPKSVVTWKRGGEVIQEGYGMTTLIIPSAKNETIVVEAKNQTTKKTLTQGVTISVSELDILWEAVGSYTPPFYKGKALPPLEGNINVVAIPKRSDISELFYAWQKDFSNQAPQSGRGKNSFSYIGNSIETQNTVSVAVSGADNTYNTQGQITIPYRNSEVVFYEEDITLGTLYNKALKNEHEVGNSNTISITAVPFFVTADAVKDDNLEMVWAINGNKVPVQPIKNKITLEGVGSNEGKTFTTIEIKNKIRIFEEGKVGLSFNF